jgi:hypothetical protein
LKATAYTDHGGNGYPQCSHLPTRQTAGEETEDKEAGGAEPGIGELAKRGRRMVRVRLLDSWETDLGIIETALDLDELQRLADEFCKSNLAACDTFVKWLNDNYDPTAAEVGERLPEIVLNDED